MHFVKIHSQKSSVDKIGSGCNVQVDKAKIYAGEPAAGKVGRNFLRASETFLFTKK